MKRILLAFAALLGFVGTGCSGPRVQEVAPGNAEVLLVIVGGNSECFHRGGVLKLYGRREDAAKYALVRDLSERLGQETRISHHYFSWTGDDEDHPGCLPGHLGWVTGGADRIMESLPALAHRPASVRSVVILGWSNGGATAYELACQLSKLKNTSVDLLVTLDPVAWTTSPCRAVAEPHKPYRPADRWINIYTASAGWERLRGGNIVALLGKAWDDQFPLRDEAADELLMLSGSHGDTEEMWPRITASAVFRDWVAAHRAAR